jgi:hypothetical protein
VDGEVKVAVEERRPVVVGAGAEHRITAVRTGAGARS